MHDFPPSRLVLLAVFVASVASAKERVPQIRNVTFPHRPDQVARPVYVAGEIATVLHFEQNVDPARTKMEGPWSSRTRSIWTPKLLPPSIPTRGRWQLL